ncbi:hypothetical protein HRR83_005917 [Exophiala dermatitidis]|nr:hypothetical protein HRR73_004392 [Exophiala dermatitidis]KAJ4552366.1 hypothetical protein HRR77_002382 [Exophiala dermatitidis]KAJ4568319.1 hypothetical protein HRR79_004548 [Exophiala dermatitidis]KAJ4579060.1 hypothetical protein HRR81_003211 [Exophiala dermatitidis]KAJ4579122.1 hypothetical protein HRR82_004921 [Exophiala dermatitidis]
MLVDEIFSPSATILAVASPVGSPRIPFPSYLGLRERTSTPLYHLVLIPLRYEWPRSTARAEIPSERLSPYSLPDRTYVVVGTTTTLPHGSSDELKTLRQRNGYWLFHRHLPSAYNAMDWREND